MLRFTYFKRAIWLILLLCLLLSISILSISYINFNLLNYKAPEEKIIIIPKGYTINKTINLLSQNHLIYNESFIRLYVKLQQLFYRKSIIAGEYKIEKDTNTKQLLNQLFNGEILIHKFTIVEGALTYNILNDVVNNYRITNDLQLDNLETKQGWLLPSTYFYSYGTQASTIINKAASDLEKFLDLEWNNKPINYPLQTKEEVLILASIIEKESSLDDEKPMIASVYLNRLKIGMPLQADPTIIFGIKKGKTFNMKLTYQDLRFESPYNTYLNKGLPPTPICNPGKMSIHAALNPVISDNLYFVADARGGHIFSTTFNNHLQNIQNYRKNLAAKKISQNN